MAEAFLLAPETKVIVCGRRKERLDDFVAKFGSDRVTAYEIDGTKLQELKEWTRKVVEENPDLNAIILNSGIQVGCRYLCVRAAKSRVRAVWTLVLTPTPPQRPTNFLDASKIDLNQMDDEITTNYTSFLHLIVHFLPHLQSLSLKGESAHIAVVTSGLALVPLPMCANYCATKAALRVLVIRFWLLFKANPVYVNLRHHLVLSIREQLTTAYPNLHIIEIFPPLVASELHDHKHQPHLAFDKMPASQRESLNEMPVDEFIVELFEGFAKGHRDIPVGTSKGAFEKLETGARFKLLDLMRPRYRAMLEPWLGMGPAAEDSK